jgi:hypothetical protein
MAEPVDRQNGNVRHSRHGRKLRIEANIPGLTSELCEKNRERPGEDNFHGRFYVHIEGTR